MAQDPSTRLQGLVFALVSAVFTTIYIPQPVLPVLGREFGVGVSGASLTVSGVVLGVSANQVVHPRSGMLKAPTVSVLGVSGEPPQFSKVLPCQSSFID